MRALAGRSLGRFLSSATFLLLLTIQFLPLSTGLTKDLELTGTLDCGAKSGAHCAIGDTVVIWTTDIDGTRRQATIDVSWIRGALPDLDQDDLVSFEVRDLGDGRFQAIAFHDPGDHQGTTVIGSSTGSRTASHGGAKDEDEDDEAVVLSNIGVSTPTPTLTPAPTSTASPTSTTTPLPTTTATATATSTSTVTSTATLSPTATSTSTPTPTSTPVPPTISISDATIQEVLGEQVTATFTITLDKVWTQTVTVLVSTQNGTYIAPADYTAVANQLVTFNPGVTSQPFVVQIDTNCTFTSKNFFANLSSPTNATILDGQGEAIVPPGSAC